MQCKPLNNLQECVKHILIPSCALNSPTSPHLKICIDELRPTMNYVQPISLSSQIWPISPVLNEFHCHPVPKFQSTYPLSIHLLNQIATSYLANPISLDSDFAHWICYLCLSICLLVAIKHCKGQLELEYLAGYFGLLMEMRILVLEKVRRLPKSVTHVI